jgi:hypothetical protein
MECLTQQDLAQLFDTYLTTFFPIEVITLVLAGIGLASMFNRVFLAIEQHLHGRGVK